VGAGPGGGAAVSTKADMKIINSNQLVEPAVVYVVQQTVMVSGIAYVIVGFVVLIGTVQLSLLIIGRPAPERDQYIKAC